MDPTQPPSNGPSRLTRRKCHSITFPSFAPSLLVQLLLLHGEPGESSPTCPCLFDSAKSATSNDHPVRKAIITRPANITSACRCRSFGRPSKMSCPPEAPVLLRPAPGYTDPLDHRKDGSWGEKRPPHGDSQFRTRLGLWPDRLRKRAKPAISARTRLGLFLCVFCGKGEPPPESSCDGASPSRDPGSSDHCMIFP